ncbi:hypothetical protein [Pararobbsia silviterrae]|uniref:Uncharacterized protein n=1 Tax=Pararobbsia silviterrae TaxID=1792498 RepID=A0A494Y6R3_9BURK|nr:hypothetical protein [Pararobbsia silviterrae]RKP58402.1 hypothetical protein D7S86_00060 [Pararobbsia silviterrae]
MKKKDGAAGAWEIHTLAAEGKLGIAFELFSNDAVTYNADPAHPQYALTSDQVHALISDLNRALLELERERDRHAHELRFGSASR